MVLTNKGYTKHYYAGTERVAARLGGGGLDALYHVIGTDNTIQTKANLLFDQSLEQVNNRILYENDLDCIMHNDFAKEEFGHWIDGIPYQMQAGVELDHSQFKDMVNSMLDDRNHGQEKEVYFYHSDHLGSASWITDFSGVAAQHIQYLPYGEPYINQRTTGYDERFTFTGKERDSETGYSYFGARYYDSDLSGLFLSVDPLSDKYPSISPYAYCAWNPLKLVDPDGRDVEVIIDHDKKTVTISAYYYVADGKYKEQVSEALGKWNALSGNFLCDFGTKEETKGYVVQFDLNVLEDNAWGSPSNYINFIDGFEDENQCGSTVKTNIEIKRSSKDIINTIAHEVGHSLGLMHHNDGLKGLMEEDHGRQSGNTAILSFDVQKIITKAIRLDNNDERLGDSSLRQIGNSTITFKSNSNVSLRKTSH